MTELTLKEAQLICNRMNKRKGRGPLVGMITIQKVQDALEGRMMAHHPVTTEILGEVTRLKSEREKKPARRKPQPKKPTKKKRK